MPVNKRPSIIGITGSIGSGKSSLSAILERNYPVFYADRIAKEGYKDPEIKKALLHRWGRGSYLSDGLPNYEFIASKAFATDTDQAFLNALLHPHTLGVMQNIVDQSHSSVLVFEVPLLFEASLDKCFDYIILVTASQSNRLNRAIARGNQLKDDILARMALQMDDSLKLPLSDFVIDNNGDLSALEHKAWELSELILSIKQRDILPFTTSIYLK